MKTPRYVLKHLFKNLIIDLYERNLRIIELVF